MLDEDAERLERRRLAKRRRRRRDRAIVGVLAVAVPLGIVIHFVHVAGRGPKKVPRPAVVTAAATPGPAAADAAVPNAARHNPFAYHALRAYLRARTGNVTAAIYDVNTGRTYRYRSGVSEQTASIMKVDILATLLWEHKTSGAPLGDSDRAVAAQMIRVSDNDDAQHLYDEEGSATAVHDFDDEIGMQNTTPNGAGYWGLTWTTADDQVDLLRHLLLPTSPLSRYQREYAYGLMRHVIRSQRWGVSGGVPPGATVALKNGWLGDSANGWQVNSVGSISGKGRHYLLAVLTDSDPTEEYGIATIRHIASAVWKVQAT